MAISLASIARTSAKPPILTLHGTPGIGKTTFAAAAPSPVFIRTEDGLGAIAAAAFPVATSWADVIGALGALYTEQHDYQTVVIDSLSALEPLIWAQVAADQKVSNIEECGYGKGYVFAAEYWQQLIDGCTALRDQKGITPILIAHSEVQRFDSPETEPFDRYQIRLHKRAMAMVYERSDIIGFCNWRTMTVRDKDPTAMQSKKSEGKTLNVRGVGTGERLLHLEERPAYLAKNRYSLPETLPLDWAAFSAALSASINPSPETK